MYFESTRTRQTLLDIVSYDDDDDSDDALFRTEDR